MVQWLATAYALARAKKEKKPHRDQDFASAKYAKVSSLRINLVEFPVQIALTEIRHFCLLPQDMSRRNMLRSCGKVNKPAP